MELQRARILEAATSVVAERGVAGASVGLVSARARVSRRSFYACFADLDECLVAIMERTLERVGELASRAFAGEACWRDGMRAALAAVLGFFDADQALARVCLVETLGAGAAVLERRAQVVATFRALMVARIESEISHVSPFAAESMLASVMGTAHARLSVPHEEPLVSLVGPLMGVIVAPFVDERTAAEEIRRGDELARQILADSAASKPARAAERADTFVPALLRDPRAHRARRCLLYVAGHPGASNRQIATAIGIAAHPQIARLLARLDALGLLVKRSAPPGRPNAWSLSPYGHWLASTIGSHGSVHVGPRVDTPASPVRAVTRTHVRVTHRQSA